MARRAPRCPASSSESRRWGPGQSPRRVRSLTTVGGSRSSTCTGMSAYTIAASKIGYLDGGHGRELVPPTSSARSRSNPANGFRLKVPIWRPGSVFGVVRAKPAIPSLASTSASSYDSCFRVARTCCRPDDRPRTIAVPIASRASARPYVVQVRRSTPRCRLSLAAMQPTGDPDGVVDSTNEPSRRRAFSLPPPPVNGRQMTSTDGVSSRGDVGCTSHHHRASVRRRSIRRGRGPDARAGIARVRSRYRTAGGAAVSDAAAAAARPREARTGAETATAFVDASGRFTFLYVPAGTYTIDAAPQISEFTTNNAGPRMYLPMPPGRYGWRRDTVETPTGMRFVSTDFRGGAGANYFGRSTLTVGSTDVRDYTLQLRPTATMRGQIVTEIVPTPRVLLPLPPQFSIRLDPAGGDAAFGRRGPAPASRLPASERSPSHRSKGAPSRSPTSYPASSGSA